MHQQIHKHVQQLTTWLQQCWSRLRYSVLLALVLALLLLARVSAPELNQQAQLYSWDQQQRWREPVLSQRVALVEITDECTAQLGDWPWPRAALGQLVRQLRSAGASVIVFPDVFASADLAGTDAVLAQALHQNGVVLARSVQEQVTDPVPVLASAAAALGFADLLADTDAVVRRQQLVRVHQDRVFHSLAVETVRTLAGDPQVQVRTAEQDLLVSVTGLQPWRQHNHQQLPLNFATEFSTVPSHDVGAFAQLHNQIVLVGLATHSHNNWIATPVGPRRSHWLQALAVHSLFEPAAVRPDWADLAETLLALLLALLCVHVGRGGQIWHLAVVWLLCAAATLLLSWQLYTQLDLILDWMWPLTSSALVFALTFYYHWARRRRHEWRIRRRFGSSVNGQQLRQLCALPAAVPVQGETREVTVLYADLRGFSALTQQLEQNAPAFAQLMRQYMDSVLPVISQHAGTLDKLLGDGVVAFWNAPLPHADAPGAGATAAVALVQQVQQLAQQLQAADPNISLCVDVGLSTGTGLLGNLGSRRRFNYTCVGGVSRTARQLENLCKHYGVNLLLDHSTVQQAQQLPGQPVLLDQLLLETGVVQNIYTVLPADADWPAEQHQRMLDALAAARWDQALRLCRELRQQPWLTHYYDVMIQRCREHKLQEKLRDSSDDN